MSDQTRDGVEIPFTEQDIKQAVQTARQELIDRTCGYLEQQYGRKFHPIRIVADPGILRVRLILQTQDGPKVNFTAEVDASEDIRETYVRFLCLNELKAVIEDALPGTVANVVLLEDYVPETDVGLSLSAYLRKHDVRRILVRMIAEETTALEKGAVIRAIKNASREFSADIAVYCYVLSGENFQLCLQKFLNLPSVSKAAIRACSPTSEFSALVEGGVQAPEVN